MHGVRLNESMKQITEAVWYFIIKMPLKKNFVTNGANSLLRKLGLCKEWTLWKIRVLFTSKDSFRGTVFLHAKERSELTYWMMPYITDNFYIIGC